jgi:hypothetical protein
MASSPEEMAQSMIANLEEKTGRNLAGWLKLLSTAGLEKHGQIVKHLKAEHGVTHGYANLIAHKYLAQGSASASEEDLVESQYAGPKADLRAIYEALIAAVEGLGKDVTLAPKKAYVSLRRSKQFALIQPSTRTRVDLGLNLPGAEPAGRLEASGSFNAMVSHRVRLESPEEVDAEIAAWLQQAYDQA